MSSWHDDLPPIPADRIRKDVIRDGELRRAQLRARRRETLTFAGVGAVAVAIVGIVALAVVTGPQRAGDDDASSVTEAADVTEVPTETAAAGTEAPADTIATGATEAATETTAAAGAETTAEEVETGATAAEGTSPAVPDHTTIGGSVTFDGVLPGLLPISAAVRVNESIISEATGGPACGPTTVTVSYERFEPIPDIPVVHWRVAGVSGEAPMTIGDRPTLALATVGPFPAETLEAGVIHELLIFITTAGEPEVLRAPLVLLRDCS